MGRTARTLTLLASAAITTMSGLAGTAMAAQVKVRVEGTGARSSASNNPILPRKAVKPTVPVTVTETPPPPAVPVDHTCAPDSAIGALDAAMGHGATGWQGSWDSVNQKLVIDKIANVPTAPTTTWSWQAYADQSPVTDPCTTPVPATSEVVFFPKCTASTPLVQASCYTGGILYALVGHVGEAYPMAPVTVGYFDIPNEVTVRLAEGSSNAPTPSATIATDEGRTFPSGSGANEKGPIASVKFKDGGPHTLTVTQGGKVPVTAPVCATNGADGFCGTVKTIPPEQGDVDFGASPCATNGHDGACGTLDTSGPVTNVINIKNQQTFAKKKAPGQIKGTIDLDPASVKDVRLRVTRVSTGRVRLKAKKVKKGHKKPKPRYRTVKRCTAWDDVTALFETAKCGTKYGKWFDASLDDLVRNFSYSFALTLPAGTYTLEVLSHDLDNHPDDITPGRNIIRFVVKSK